MNLVKFKIVIKGSLSYVKIKEMKDLYLLSSRFVSIVSSKIQYYET